MENERNLYHDLDSILYSREEIAAAVRALGERITADYRGKNPVFICILKGASVFFSDLIRQVDLPLEIEFMAVSSYGASTKSSGEVRLVKDLDRSILGRDVIIVEDIVDSGMTLHFLKKLLITRGAASLRIAALMDKPARRVAPLTVDYSCFQIPDAFVVGYGLDYNEGLPQPAGRWACFPPASMARRTNKARAARVCIVFSLFSPKPENRKHKGRTPENTRIFQEIAAARHGNYHLPVSGGFMIYFLHSISQT